ncbi:MAG: Rne/Rng family ribonuclease [Actinomycetota bacterium]
MAETKAPSRRRRRRRRSGGAGRAKTARKTMLVTAGPDRHQIAVLEARSLVEHYVTRSGSRSIVGNIYMGKVHNVLPGMEAAFIDIGVGRNAVLYAGEVGFDEEVEGPRPRIETVLKSGQQILAQVTKDPMGSKGARLTTEISLAGRYLVLVPEGEGLGISRRLSDDERKRLREIASELVPAGYGVIIRTAAEGAGPEELRRDLDRLLEIWHTVYKKTTKAAAPSLIHEEPELVIRVVRDLFTDEVGQLVVDDPEVHKKIREYLEAVTPELTKRVELYEDELPLFERYHVIEQIRKALDRKVWLPSGGHIVIEKTEALTVIDVNTGRYVGKSTLEETVLKNNLEAAQEVAKQLKLRDIGGIIVIDFIDMIEESNRQEVLRAFREALAPDKARTEVHEISDLGLMQMTRKRVSEGLLEAFSTACDKCGGWGVLLTDLD